MKKITNILYWIAMIGLLFWFAYSKGWILTNFKSIDAQQAISLLENDNNVTLLDVRTIPRIQRGTFTGCYTNPCTGTSTKSWYAQT